MFEEYQLFILQLYENKRTNNQLLRELIKPTVANLRKASLKTVEQRYRRKDDKTLSEFFGTQTGIDGFKEAIRKTDPDDYKTIYRWLRGEIKSTSEANVELFAWLIDFEERPFNSTTDYGALLKNMLDENKAIPENIGDTPELEVGKQRGKNEKREQLSRKPEVPSEQIKSNNKSRLKSVLIGSIIVVLITIFGVYLWQHYTVSSGPQDCVYWDGEKYQSSPCFVKREPPVQLKWADSVKQMHFQRNMRPDTLTAYSIGKAWYIHIRGRYEYYTDSGYYPLDTNLRLLKVTARILNKDYPRKPVK